MPNRSIPIRRRVLLGTLLCAMAGARPIPCADDPNRTLSPSPSTAPQELLLVRAWKPETGELIGWMPMHRVTLTLQRLAEDRGTPTFDLNEILTVDFPYRPYDAAKYGRLRVIRETANFLGREWMPVQQAPNLVRIHKFTFYVKSIDFIESKW